MLSLRTCKVCGEWSNNDTVFPERPSAPGNLNCWRMQRLDRDTGNFSLRILSKVGACMDQDDMAPLLSFERIPTGVAP